MHYQLSQALSADDGNMIGAVSRKALRRGVTHTQAFDVQEIIHSADRKLFTRITQPGHCLHLLLPKTSAYCPYSLRKRQHSYQFPHIEFSQYKNSFINRCLFGFSITD